MHEPIYHQPTHGVPVASLQLRSYHPNLLDLFTHFTSHTAAALGIPISKPVHLPIKRRLWTVPKSPFVHKKAQENFERKVYRRVIKAWDADQEVIERWIAYIRTHRMPAVGMRLTRWERAPVGVGRQLTDSVQKAWQAKMLSDEQKMKQIADSIIQRETEAATPTAKVDPAVVKAPKATKQPTA
jgi:small subunit ribosomal protein S10